MWRFLPDIEFDEMRESVLVVLKVPFVSCL